MSGHLILVVEDNPATRKLVRFALGARGHQVVEALDGAAALRIVETQRPALVLQDLVLPDMDGFTLVGELRRRVPDVPILAFSGFISEFEEARMSSLGFDEVITKPIEPARLVAIVESHLPGGPRTTRVGAGRRLLLAGEDAFTRKLIEHRLRRFGYDVIAVASGTQALTAAIAEQPDVVVADLRLPGLDGLALAAAMRAEPELDGMPVILLADPGEGDAARAARAGAGLAPRTPALAELLELLAPLSARPPRPPHPAAPSAEMRMRASDRHSLLNAGLARRCSALAAELTVLAGITEAVLRHRDVDQALDEALAACFDAGGISMGVLYLFDDGDDAKVRTIGSHPAWTPEAIGGFFGHRPLLDTIIGAATATVIPSDAVPEDDARAFLAACRAQAAMVVPLVHLGRPLGALLMAARGRELERDDWRAFAQGVGNQITQVLALARAFAEKEQAEKQARAHEAEAVASRARWQALVENAPDLIASVDREGVIRSSNRGFAGIPRAGLVGMSLAELVLPEQRAALRRALANVLAEGTPTTLEMAVRGATGQLWYSSHIGAIQQEGAVVGAVVIARDITQRKETEAQLIVADRMASIGTLAAGVAHEINNPLASVMANLELALQEVTSFGGPSIDELNAILRDAQESADRVRLIVRDLKIFSRTEEETLGAVDVERVLESTLRMAWNEIRHRARLTKDYAPTPPVTANEARLGQVFLNLLVNAAQSIGEGQAHKHEIRVTTRTDDRGRVVVTVSDTGCGIPEELRPRLFTPFFTTKPVGVGTGLGLSICHRIITAHGGEIGYTSQVGQGTEFRVVLPTTPIEMVAPAPAPLAVMSASRRGRVLVVDDEPLITNAVKRALAREHDVTAVDSATEAFALLRAGERYDVVLCDLMMPEMTGMDLHAAVHAAAPDQAERMVFLTGGAFTTRAREFLDTVSNRRLEKPFDTKSLRALVGQIVG